MGSKFPGTSGGRTTFRFRFSVLITSLPEKYFSRNGKYAFPIARQADFLYNGRERQGSTLFDITLIAMGKLKEKFYISAADEYKKRLGGYCKFTLLELPEVRLPENPSPAEISAGLEKEAELIFQKVPKGAWFCVFTPEGKELSSERFADKLKEVKLAGKSSACFLIGSSFGMAPRVKEKADFKLSMGPMTFPHHLARIMVLEQIYRAEAIQAGSKYHK